MPGDVTTLKGMTFFCRKGLLLILLVCGCSAGPRVSPPYPIAPRPPVDSSAFALVSDTQTPLWFEEIRLKDDGNDLVPWKIFSNIARDTGIAAVFHLGDLTALGSWDSYWEDFERKTSILRTRGIPLFPAFGNHEYMPFSSAGRENMIARFPFMNVPWYCRRIGPSAIVILNSNFSRLTRLDMQEQELWYRKTLADLDRDTTVTCVLVACHHPPYTNSTVVGPSPDVRRLFVPAFLEARKARVFVTGHAHAFEHFHIGGKDFLVIGGGGGLLHPLLQGRERRAQDLYPHDSPRSFFHYVRCSAARDGLCLRVIRVRADNAPPDTAYTLRIPFSE